MKQIQSLCLNSTAQSNEKAFKIIDNHKEGTDLIP